MKTFTVSNKKNETSDFTSIGAAFRAIEQVDGPVTLNILEGTYHEVLELKRPDVTLLGAGPDKTIISMNRYAYEILEDGLKRGTFRTQTFFIDADNVTVKDLTIENTAGPGSKYGQAIALYADGDNLLFENVHILGNQDTLFTGPLPPKEFEPGGFRGPKQFAPRRVGNHYYKNCFIAGTVDFIFGGATCLFEGCTLHSLDPERSSGNSLENSSSNVTPANSGNDPAKTPGNVIKGYVTAASTPEESETGYVFHNCRFTSDCPDNTVYLGRPWREFAKTVLIDCELGPHIRQEGWHDWGKTDAHRTIFYAEYDTGCIPGKRAPFAHVLTQDEARDILEKARAFILYNIE